MRSRKKTHHRIHKRFVIYVFVAGITLFGYYLSPFSISPDNATQSDERIASNSAQLNELPGVKGIRERTIVLGGRIDDAEITIRPGEVQHLRIRNISKSELYIFKIENLRFYIVARDGHTLDKPVEEESELLAPGDRIDALVKPSNSGFHDIVSLTVGADGKEYRRRRLNILESSGWPVIGMNIPEDLLPYEDLRTATVEEENIKRLTMPLPAITPAEEEYYYESEEEDENTLATVVEEWTVENSRDEWQILHLTTPFQVVEVNKKAVDRGGYDDTYAVPARTTIKIRLRQKQL